MTMRPDPTFHASPKLAMEAPPESFAYTLLLSPDFSKPDALAVIDVKPGSAELRSGRPHRDDAQQGGRVSPFRVERLLVGLVAAHRRTHSSSAATSSSPVSDPPGFTSSTRNRIPPRRRFTRSSSPRRSSGRPATRGRIRSTAGRMAFTSARSAAAARMVPMDRPASSSWTARRSMSSDGGRSIAVLKPCTMTSGGTCHATTWCPANGHCHRSSRTGSCRRIFSRTNMAIGSTSGICGPGETSRPSISAPTIKWRWKCAPRMIPFASTASWASWSTPQTSKARSGPGGARAASFTSRRRRRSHPNPRRRTSCRRFCRALAPCRRW